MLIRRAAPGDEPAIAAVIPTIRAGTTYTLDTGMTEADALAYWLAPDKQTFVAEDAGAIVGTYYIRPNQAGRRPRLQPRLAHARSSGYRPMQFNFVVSPNLRAVRLWQSLGFDILARLPEAFHHLDAGYVDAFVMFQALKAF